MHIELLESSSIPGQQQQKEDRPSSKVDTQDPENKRNKLINNSQTNSTRYQNILEYIMKETQQKSMHNSNIAIVEQTYPDINILTYYLPSVKIPHLQSNICNIRTMLD